MIDIHEYIKNFRNSHPSFKDANKGIISEFIKYNSDLSHIKEVCTTEVYPQCLKLNGEEFLIWDHTFWMLYRRFLLGVWRFSPNKTTVEDLSDFLSSFQNLFLSLRFTKIPAFSYYFAQEYYRENKLIRNFQWISDTEQEINLFGVNLFKQIDDFAQWQVFLHEMRHYTYRKNNNLFLRDLETIKSIFKQYDSVLRSRVNYDKENYDKFYDNYSYYANDAPSSELEEICCDIFAMVDFYEMYLKREDQSSEEVLLAYFSTIRYLLELQKIFTITERMWLPITYVSTYWEGDNQDYKNHDWTRYNEITKYITDSRSSIVYTFVAHILGVDTSAVYIENELFDSDYYAEALKNSITNSFGEEDLAYVYSFINTISRKFDPKQLQSARNLLIGWY